MFFRYTYLLSGILGLLLLISSEAKALPSAPIDLEFFPVSLTKIEIRFTDLSATIDDATFVIERSTLPNSGFVTLTNPVVPDLDNVLFSSTDISTFTSNVTYYYRVRARNSSGFSTALTGSVLMPAAPSAPTNLTATRYPTEIDLTWTDTSTNENEFIIQQATAIDGLYKTIANIGPNTRFLAVTNLSSDSPYFFKIASSNAGGTSYATNILTTSTLAATPITSLAGSSLVVITNEGPELPPAAVNTLCSSSPLSIINKLGNWLNIQANKYGASRPFTSIACAASSVGTVLQVDLSKEPSLFNSDVDVPLIQSAVVNYLENDARVDSQVKAAIHSAKYVKILHYYSVQDYQADSNVYNNKYSFHFITPYPIESDPSIATEFLPELTPDRLGLDFANQFMASLGAINKQAPLNSDTNTCTIEAATGLPYPGQEIMCLFIPLPLGVTAGQGSGVSNPSFDSAIVSTTTAKEVGWIAANNQPPAPMSLRIVPK